MPYSESTSGTLPPQPSGDSGWYDRLDLALGDVYAAVNGVESDVVSAGFADLEPAMSGLQDVDGAVRGTLALDLDPAEQAVAKADAAVRKQVNDRLITTMRLLAPVEQLVGAPIVTTVDVPPPQQGGGGCAGCTRGPDGYWYCPYPNGQCCFQAGNDPAGPDCVDNCGGTPSPTGMCNPTSQPPCGQDPPPAGQCCFDADGSLSIECTPGSGQEPPPEPYPEPCPEPEPCPVGPPCEVCPEPEECPPEPEDPECRKGLWCATTPGEVRPDNLGEYFVKSHNMVMGGYRQ